MDSNRLASADRLPTLVRWLVAFVVVAYAWTIYREGSPFAAGADSSGYFNGARLLASGQIATVAREIPGYPPPWPYYSHMPLGFIIDRGNGRLVPTYPIGLPLHLLVAAPIVGWEKTARVVNAFNVLAAGALLYALGRRLGLQRGWALGAVAALWLNPVWILHARQPMSDPLAVTWCLAAVVAAWSARTRWPWAFAAGAALGMAVLVRPANLILALPLAFAFRGSWRAWLACGAGGLPLAAIFFYYNTRAFGDPLATGYGALEGVFAWSYVPHNLAHFALWLPLLTGVPVALAALLLPWTSRAPDRGAPPINAGLLLGAWLLTFVAFYASYYFAGETWWYLRFLLPAFPALILAGLLVCQALATRSRHWRKTVAAMVLVGFAGQYVAEKQLINFSVRQGERRYLRTCEWLNQNLPADAIVASCQLSGAQFYYTKFPLLRWDQLPAADMLKVVQGIVAAQRPLYAVLFQFEKERAQTEHLPGRWTLLHEIEDVGIWKFAGFETAPARP